MEPASGNGILAGNVLVGQSVTRPEAGLAVPGTADSKVRTRVAEAITRLGIGEALLPALLLVGLATGCQRAPGAADGGAADGGVAAAGVAQATAVAEVAGDAGADAASRVNPDETTAMGADDGAAPQPEGVFTGTLPCADCPGVETTLVLHADGGYELVERQGRGAPVSRRQGAWYSSADGHAILIAADDDGAGHHIFEWYGDDALRLLPDRPQPEWDDAFLLVRAD